MLAFWLLAMTVFPAPAAAERYVGTVVKTEISPPALSIQLDGGGMKWVAAPSDAAVLRVAPGDKDLTRAAKLRFDEVREGDRVLVRAEGEPPLATQIVVLSQGDLARKQQAERDDWKRRGVSGRVAAVNPETGEVTIHAAGRLGATTLVVKAGAQTEQRRYRPDSARFSDARASTIRDIRAGDQIQALGDRTPEGTAMAAEKIVSGSFRNFTATVDEVRAAQQEIVVRAAGNGPPVVVKIAPGSILRRLSPEAALQLAGQKKAKAGAQGPQNILEGSAPLTAAELRSGDAVVIATVDGAAGDGGSNVTAIAVIAGVEPLLKRSAEAQREALGSWDLSLDPESGDRGGSR